MPAGQLCWVHFVPSSPLAAFAPSAARFTFEKNSSGLAQSNAGHARAFSRKAVRMMQSMKGVFVVFHAGVMPIARCLVSGLLRSMRLSAHFRFGWTSFLRVVLVTQGSFPRREGGAYRAQAQTRGARVATRLIGDRQTDREVFVAEMFTREAKQEEAVVDFVAQRVPPLSYIG